MVKVWLVTGSASGLGRKVAEQALEAGHALVATARNPMLLDDLKARYGGKVRIVQVDVTNEGHAATAVRTAVESFGRVDVLVNNAGYGDLRPFEQVSSQDFRALVDAVFFGVVNMTRAVLPYMRSQRSGHIIQISSLGGRIAFPGNAAYCAAKCAVGGFTEGLALEVGHLGIKLSSLEPGGMRTNWGKRASAARAPVHSDYDDSVGVLLRQLEGYWGNETGDPDKVAAIILKLAECVSLPPHILIGSDAFEMSRRADKIRTDASIRWEAVSRWADLSSSGSLPVLPNE